MEAMRLELKRLARGQARAVGAARAVRWHLGLLGVAVVLAFIHRAALPLPVLDRLESRWLPTALVAAALLAAGPLLRVLVVRLVRRPERALARDLDDRYHWHDVTDTAVGLARRGVGGPMESLVLTQASGRLRALATDDIARVGTGWRRPRIALALLFVAVLLLPGVDGLLGLRGGGRQGGGLAGSEGPEEPLGAPRPMRADFWMQSFVENPLPVEPLPEPKAPGPVAPKAGGGR